MTTTNDLIRWFKEGLKKKATHMLVVCDTFEYEDYPVYVSATEDVRKIFANFNGVNMQRVMEVYNLSKSINEQMKPGTRVFNF